MKYVLIMNENSYVGREYLYRLAAKDIAVDVVSVGKYPVVDIDEEKRCGGQWTPPMLQDIRIKGGINHFDSLKDEKFINFLQSQKYDIAIQGGTGIIKKNVIDCFKYGILNFHPGDLPAFRGCSAPEWQIFENKPVICTCHLIDEGIDSGKIYKKKVLFEADTGNYFEMRSKIYPKIAFFVTEVMSEIDETFVEKCYIQDETKSCYREYIGEDKINLLIKKMAYRMRNYECQCWQ